MDIGMLWYDDDRRRPLDDKIARAVEYYKAKYGATPTVCFVNPATLQGGPETAAGVHLRTARDVMADHFWIGVGEAVAANGQRNGNGNRKSAHRSDGRRAAKNGHRAG